MVLGAQIGPPTRLQVPLLPKLEEVLYNSRSQLAYFPDFSLTQLAEEILPQLDESRLSSLTELLLAAELKSQLISLRILEVNT